MTGLQIIGAGGDGGAETYYVKLTTALHAAQPQCAALRPHGGRQAALTAAGVPLATFGFGGPLDLLTRPALARYARGHDVRYLVAWMNRAARHAPRGPWARIGRMGGYYGLKYYRGFDMLVGNTPDIVRYMIDAGVPQHQARYIPNFADVPPAPPEDRAQHGTPNDVPLLLAPGRLHSAKGHDVAISALRDIPHAHLWIVGSGDLDAALRQQAQQQGVADRVRFLGWRSDMGALYAACDLVVFPSRFEPLGNVVIEAWSVGKPIIAAKATGPAGLIRPGQDGDLVAVDDADALAASINAVIADPARGQDWAAAGLERAKAFRVEAVVAQWLDLFNALQRGQTCAA